MSFRDSRMVYLAPLRLQCHAGQLVSYMYITPTKTECVNGEDWKYNKFAEGGKWYTMYMHVKLNEPGTKIHCTSAGSIRLNEFPVRRFHCEKAFVALRKN